MNKEETQAIESLALPNIATECTTKNVNLECYDFVHDTMWKDWEAEVMNLTLSTKELGRRLVKDMNLPPPYGKDNESSVLEQSPAFTYMAHPEVHGESIDTLLPRIQEDLKQTCFDYDRHSYFVTAKERWDNTEIAAPSNDEFLCGKLALYYPESIQQSYKAMHEAQSYAMHRIDQVQALDATEGDWSCPWKTASEGGVIRNTSELLGIQHQEDESSASLKAKRQVFFDKLAPGAGRRPVFSPCYTHDTSPPTTAATEVYKGKILAQSTQVNFEAIIDRAGWGDSGASDDISQSKHISPSNASIRHPNPWSISQAYVYEGAKVLPRRHGACRTYLEDEIVRIERDCNGGFGIIEIRNPFTHAGAEAHEHDPQIPDSSREVVLMHVEFRNGRIGLFQAPAWCEEDPEVHLLDAFENFNDAGEELYVVISMDRGLDLGKIVNIRNFELTEGFPKAPYMPVVRLALPSDLEELRMCRKYEAEIFNMCTESLQSKAMKKVAKTLRVVDVELQLDFQRLIVFVECTRKTDWNKFSPTIFKKVEKIYKKTPRVWFQRRDVESFSTRILD